MALLGWDPYDLDNAITTMQSTTAPGLSQLSPQFLRQTACAAAAMTAYSLPVASDVALFAPAPTAATIATRDIPTLPGDDERYSLYHDLFENLTVLNPPDPVFTLNASGTEIAAIASAPQLSDHSAALTAARASPRATWPWRSPLSPMAASRSPACAPCTGTPSLPPRLA